MNESKIRLTDLLADTGQGDLATQWADTTAAAERELLPPGKYLCRVARGELGKSRTGTPRYTVRFDVMDGPHAGAAVFADHWLTAAALPQTKRDLAKLGVQSLSQLERPVPPGIVCEVHVVIRSTDGGDQRNAVKRFNFVRHDAAAVDDPDFAPPATTSAAAVAPASGDAPPAKGGG